MNAIKARSLSISFPLNRFHLLVFFLKPWNRGAAEVTTHTNRIRNKTPARVAVPPGFPNTQPQRLGKWRGFVHKATKIKVKCCVGPRGKQIHQGIALSASITFSRMWCFPQATNAA